MPIMDTQDIEPMVRISLTVRPSDQEYLQHLAYKRSAPGNLESQSSVFRFLVDEYREKHPEDEPEAVNE